MAEYVFGPVPSRRLGQSLGIDTIPLKTCNWNCVYCQLGRTRPLVNKRIDYYPPDEILREVEEALKTHKPGEIDWVTFVGSGEPTLHASIGWLIRSVKQMTDIPVALITNGALFYIPEVCQAVLAADAVLPSLDAGSPTLFREINRPHPEITFKRFVYGLTTFQRSYWKNLWVEIMLVRGVNDSTEALEEIAFVLDQIVPDEVHINLPTRPPVETWVQPTDIKGLERAKTILGNNAKVVLPVEGSFDLGKYDNPVEAILAIITRHPMREEELVQSLKQWAPGHVDEALNELQKSGLAQVVERNRIRYWSAEGAHFPESAQSQRTIPDPRRRDKRGIHRKEYTL